MKRRKFIYQTSLGLAMLPVADSLKLPEVGGGPYFATGIKIGEATDSSIVIWLRLTKDPKPVGKQALIPNILYLDETNGVRQPVNYFKEKYKLDRPDRKVKVVYPDGYSTSNIEGAVPGAAGEARVNYRKKGITRWNTTNWKKVDKTADYTATEKLTQLEPGTSYELKIEARVAGSRLPSSEITGKFATAVHAGTAKKVHFMVTTCHEYNDQDDPSGGGFKIYKHMQALDPDFMVHTGDVVYYDQKAKNIALAHWHWQRMFGLPNCVEFYKQVPCYFMKDDHDTWMNDCCPQSVTRFMGDFTFKDGVKIFNEHVPVSEKPYRTFRWGKHLQIWLAEGREYRTDNNLPDSPEKTIWGKAQMEWFQKTFAASDATFRILISPTPIVGPDRPQKNDNHANKGFAYEGSVIKKFLAQQKNSFIVCGDRHWQYVSQDTETGLFEFTCGPASNEHASGWKKEDVLPQHKYLNIVGGFLGIEIKQADNPQAITFTHYSVDGEKLYSKDYNRKA